MAEVRVHDRDIGGVGKGEAVHHGRGQAAFLSHRDLHRVAAREFAGLVRGAVRGIVVHDQDHARDLHRGEGLRHLGNDQGEVLHLVEGGEDDGELGSGSRCGHATMIVARGKKRDQWEGGDAGGDAGGVAAEVAAGDAWGVVGGVAARAKAPRRCFSIRIDSTVMSAGVTPEIRLAWARVRGLTLTIFSLASKLIWGWRW